MTIDELLTESWQINEEKGWHEDKRTDGEYAALFHSEISEMVEEVRKGHGPGLVYLGDENKPEGIPVELADVIIRIADYCACKEIDLQAALRLKLDYNRKRPRRHGGKKL